MADRWLSDPIWNTFIRCWGQNPQSRPSIGSLHQAFIDSGKEQKRNTPTTGNGEGKRNAVWFFGKLVIKPDFIYSENTYQWPNGSTPQAC